MFDTFHCDDRRDRRNYSTNNINDNDNDNNMYANVQPSSSSSYPSHSSSTKAGVAPSKFNTNVDTLSFYLSHLFHGIIYYHCVKFIIQDFILNKNGAADSNKGNSIISSLAFYGVYHRTPYNQLIHLIGVPFIIWTMMLYGAYLPFTFTTIASPSHESKMRSLSLQPYIPKMLLFPQQDQHRITWAALWVVLYAGFYCYIDFIGACLYAPSLYIMYVTSVHWSQHDLRRQQEPKQKVKMDDPINGQNSVPTASIKYHWYGSGNVLLQAFIVHVLSWYIQIHLGHGILEGATPASLVNLGAALTSAPLFAFYEIVWYLGYRLPLQQQVLQQVTIYTEQLCAAGANLRVCTMPSF
jgi:2-hydroxy fatty acid dioxygenase